MTFSPETLQRILGASFASLYKFALFINKIISPRSEEVWNLNKEVLVKKEEEVTAPTFMKNIKLFYSDIWKAFVLKIPIER